ncbi:Ca2+-binding RTX toxin-like protein [Bradyrhizobium sp. LB7.2]
MSYEIDNLVSPYPAVARIYVWFSYDDYQADVASNFTTFHGATGSGVFIGGNDFLTASHVVYDVINNRIPYRIEVVPGYDSNYPASGAAEAPYGVLRADSVAYFNNVDPNHDGNFLSGDNASGTLSGSEIDVAVIDVSIINSAATPAPMRMDTSFSSGSLRLTGYPASANGNPMEELVSASRSGVDNSYLVSGTLGPGSSGGPAWGYVSGVATVFGVVSTTAAVAGLAAHANWIADYVRLDNDNIVYTSANDIVRPYIREFELNKPAGFDVLQPYQFLTGGTFFGSTIDGGSGVDTIALPFDSQTGVFSDSRLNYVNSNAESGAYVTWSKAANGVISGYLYSNSEVTSFVNVERLAFSDVVFDLTLSVVGTQYRVGPAAGATVVTSTLGGMNPVIYRIQSVAGEDGQSDQLFGSSDPDQMYGLGGDDELWGAGGDDRLDGGTGVDVLVGDVGNDTYLVENAGDIIIEAVGAGIDQVATSVSFVLRTGQEVERLTTMGSATTADINLTGNEFGQTLVGNAGMNRLDGKSGADLMYGMAGNDVYIPDNAGDRVYEAIGGGSDQVATSISFVLGTGQEG